MQKSAIQLKIEAQLQASIDLLKQAKRYVGQSNTIGGQDLSREITEFVASVDRNPRVPPPYAPDSGPALFVKRCEQIGTPGNPWHHHPMSSPRAPKGLTKDQIVEVKGGGFEQIASVDRTDWRHVDVWRLHDLTNKG